MAGNPYVDAAGVGVDALSLLNDYYNTQAHNSAASQARKDMGKYIDAYANDMDSKLNQYNLASNQSLLNYQNKLSDIENEQNALTYDFDKSKYNVDDYYDQNRAQQLGNTARTAQGTAALAGMGRSLGSAQGIASSVADKDSTLADKAYQRMQADMNTDMSIADKQLSLAQSKLNSRLNNANSLFSAYQNSLDSQTGNQISYANSLLSANLNKASTI